MENASKALIIAGAILLSILLISLGIMVFNQANGVINQNAMSELEISQFNQKFTQYEGDRVRGTTVRSMLQPILANNMSADSDDRKVDVKLVYYNSSGGTANANLITKAGNSITGISNVKTGAIFSVVCTYETGNKSNKGLVTTITITELKS